MLKMNRTLEEFLDEAALVLHAPEYLDYEESDLEQDLRQEVILCESAADILARMRLANLLEAWPERAAASQPALIQDRH